MPLNMNLIAGPAIKPNENGAPVYENLVDISLLRKTRPISPFMMDRKLPPIPKSNRSIMRNQREY